MKKRLLPPILQVPTPRIAFAAMLDDMDTTNKVLILSGKTDNHLV